MRASQPPADYRAPVASRAADVAVGLRPQRVVWALRGVLLIACVLASLPLRVAPRSVAAALLLLLVAGTAVRLAAESPAGRAARLVEAVLAGLAVWGTGLAASPFFSYLLVPALAAGLTTGVVDAVLVTAAGAVTFLGVGLVAGTLSGPAYTTVAGQYVIVALAIGAVAAWARRLLRLQQAEHQPLYGEAFRLLTQLRSVTRQLPGTLDPRTVAAGLLDEARAAVPGSLAAVYVRTGGGRLTALGRSRDGLVHWRPDARQLSDDSPFADAWASQAETLLAPRDSAPWLAVVPLVVGVRTCGLLALEGNGGQPPERATLSRLVDRANDTALRLETALLFDEVRDLATAEERQRLAREIHDGIAQELVTIGYAVDNAVAELPAEAAETRDSLRTLRAEVTRLISELRLSLFDLRADIEPHGGLGAAIGAYLRTVGATSGLTVHITLNEAADRLPAGTEIELLRIAQEAVTNARKHARARNLWVTCDVDPPYARLVVADDGTGIDGPGRTDSFGLSVMHERAQRLHAELAIRHRPGGGTVVDVTLAGRAAPATRDRLGPASPGETEAPDAHQRAADRRP